MIVKSKIEQIQLLIFFNTIKTYKMNYNILYNIGEYISSFDKYMEYLSAILEDKNLRFAIDNWIRPKIDLRWNVKDCSKSYRYLCYKKGYDEKFDEEECNYFTNYKDAHKHMRTDFWGIVEKESYNKEPIFISDTRAAIVIRYEDTNDNNTIYEWYIIKIER